MEDQNIIPIMLPDLVLYTIITSKWLQLPISLLNFYGPKGAQAIEVMLYYGFIVCMKNSVDPNQLASDEAS